MTDPLACILRQCVHARKAACEALGKCGAAALLDFAKVDGGTRVICRDNPTLAALLKAKLVMAGRTEDPAIVTIRVTRRGAP